MDDDSAAQSPIPGSLAFKPRREDMPIDLLQSDESEDEELVPLPVQPDSPTVSPATQTLNGLSQDNKLEYDMSQLEYDVAEALASVAKSDEQFGRNVQRIKWHDEVSVTATEPAGDNTKEWMVDDAPNDSPTTDPVAPTSTKAAPKPTPAVMPVATSPTTYRFGDDYDVRKLSITKPGKLGMTISRVAIPARLKKYWSADGQETACRVDGVNVGLAQGAGFCLRDLLLEEVTEPMEPSGKPTLRIASYDTVHGLALKGARPFTFWVARLIAKQSTPAVVAKNATVRSEKSQKRNRLSNEIGSAKPDSISDPMDGQSSLASTEHSAAPRQKSKTGKSFKQKTMMKEAPKSTGVKRTKSRETTKPSATTKESTVHGAEQRKKPSPTDAPKAKTHEGSVPFCALCNGRTTHPKATHHAWCPMNKHFEKSGAKTVLEDIRMGMTLGCDTCINEYSQGRSLREHTHSSACRAYRAQREEDDGSPSPLQPKGKSRKRTSDAIDPTSSDEDGIETDSSPYRQPPAKKRPLQKLVVTKSNPVSSTSQVRKAPLNNVRKAPTAPNEKKKAPKANKTSASDEAKRKKPAPKRTAGEEKGKSNKGSDFVIATAAARSEAPTRTITPLQIEVNTDDKSIDTMGDVTETIWEPAVDPWGPSGYKEGDIHLLSSSNWSGHHECLLPGRRYDLDPFATYSRYSKTHHTSDDGFHVVMLRRDPTAVMPWGFTVQRHDFGGACLVTSVAPLSPASAATFVTKPSSLESSAKLRVNDMLVAVNGKLVGGMSEEGLSLELEMCGPVLVLVVARCKSVASPEQRLAAEQEAFHDIDRATNDELNLDWIDVGLSRNEIPQRHEQEQASVEDDGGSVPSVLPTNKTTSEDRLVASPLSDKRGGTGSRSAGFPAKIPSVTSSKPMPDQSTRVKRSLSPPASPATSITSKPLSASEDDGNAWFGCVCGEIHKNPVPVFWVQCDHCGSWYNVANECVRLSEREVERMPSWRCWGCPPEESKAKDPPTAEADATTAETGTGTKPESLPRSVCAEDELPDKYIKPSKPPEKNADGSFMRPHSRKPREDCIWDSTRGAWALPAATATTTSTHQRTTRVPSEMLVTKKQTKPFTQKARKKPTCEYEAPFNEEQSKPNNLKEIFEVGDMVCVAEHAWATVNNEGGIGKVLKAFIDEDGDMVYDIKYIVGGTARGVLAEFVSRHKWL